MSVLELISYSLSPLSPPPPSVSTSVIVLGDMNFRVRETPEWVIEQAARSIRYEIKLHKRLLGEEIGLTWRDGTS